MWQFHFSKFVVLMQTMCVVTFKKTWQNPYQWQINRQSTYRKLAEDTAIHKFFVFAHSLKQNLISPLTCQCRETSHRCHWQSEKLNYCYKNHVQNRNIRQTKVKVSCGINSWIWRNLGWVQWTKIIISTGSIRINYLKKNKKI